MAKVNVSLPDDLLKQVDGLAGELNSSRSGFVQEATARYVAEIRRERAVQERRHTIGAAMAEARDIASKVPAGEDGTDLIRRDRDSHYGRDPEGG